MAWVISLKHNPFEEARVKLTGYYLCVMILIVGIFSFALVRVIEKNISDSVRTIPGDAQIRESILTKTIDEMEDTIIIFDGVLLMLVGGMSYFLAGRTLRPIKKTFEMQKRFTADASHDLRTPLTIMKTEMEVALQNKNSSIDKYKEVLRSGLEEIGTMSLLVEDLLALARSESKHQKEEGVSLNYTQCLSSLVARMNPQAHAKEISITLETIPGTIFVNEISFVRALQNIIYNAIHYTKEHGAIHIILTKSNKHYILTISDNGVGISKEDLPNIFNRFYKASHSRNDATGSGLGLSIAKEFIEQYGGTIKVTSGLNKGTSVTITMPGE